MKKSIHDELVKAIKLNTPPDENPVDVLMDIIPMSKEAAYRRLRGEIQFSLEEAARISQKLKTSLRNLFEWYADNHYINFHIYQLEELSIADTGQYAAMIKQMKTSFEYLTSQPDKPTIYVVSNSLPQGFFMAFELLRRFYVYKGIYQKSRQKPVPKLSDLVLSEEVEKDQFEFSLLSKKFHSVYIVEDDMFLPVVKDIRFFNNLGLISDTELKTLKEELNRMIDRLEEYANTGKTEFGCSTLCYISEISFDASYIYIELKNGYQIASQGTYGLNFLGSEDPDICTRQKEWIESLIRYSNCISKSGELERIKFFREQRACVNTL